MTRRKLKWQTTSDGKHKVRTTRRGEVQDNPQAVVDYLGEEFEKEKVWWARAREKMRNAGK